MANRRGGPSIVRISIIAALIGVVFIAAAAVTYFTDQASKRVPLDIALIPNATYWGTGEEQPTSRKLFYLTTDTPEAVALYYQQKMEEHYKNNDQGCVRFPATGNAPGSESDSRISPYLYRCMFDNSGFNSSQFTQVEIYPGHADPNPALDVAGFTVIKYEQQWQQ